MTALESISEPLFLCINFAMRREDLGKCLLQKVHELWVINCGDLI